MRVFVCAGEPSGDLHAANLIRGLRRLRPGLDCDGYGGERMEAAGCRVLYPLCSLAVMGFSRIFAALPQFTALVRRVDRYFRRERPDAVVLLDYPGFNWWVARRAKERGIPVFYFVPPQLWAWAGWRVRKMRRLVDHVLCNLPFEEAWYRARGVNATCVGHPYFDELAGQALDPEFLGRQRQLPGDVVGLLPGSRTQEVELNLPTLLGAARRIHAARPETRFLVACFKESHQRMVEQGLRADPAARVEPCLRRTPEVIHLARACVAVSGSVGLELMYHGTPSVVVYRTNRSGLAFVNLVKSCRYISLVNLLAEKELFPEYLTARCEAEAVSRHVLRWLDNPAERQRVVEELATIKQRVAQPGACERAARYLVEHLDVRAVAAAG